MSIKFRLALLLGLLLVVFLLSLLVLRSFEDQQLKVMLASSQRDNVELIERWIDLTGQSLRQFAYDYSLWDDTVQYVAKPDPAWAKINLEASLPNFNAHALWIMRPDGSVLYGVDAEDHDPSDAPIAGANLLALTANNPFFHFFAEHHGELIEIRGAPIQPSDDLTRTSPGVGWLLVARRWDDAHLRTLANLTECEVRLTTPDAPPLPEPEDETRISLLRPLNDGTGRTLKLLHLHRSLPEISQMLHSEAFEARTFVAFGLLVIVSLGLSLQRWVLQPLGWIGESLATGNPAAIRPLLSERTELSRVAQLIESSFAQQTALRESEAALRRTLEERARLGRDLHDGVIQSIYAAGMGLAATRTILKSNPADAEQRIDQVRAALNETIRELRGFITGLEPEAFKQRTFTQAVSALVEFLESTGSVDVRVAIDEPLVEMLPTTARTDALQIIREAMSNSLRHGHAAKVTISLTRADDFARLEIVDDGTGFDPAESRPGGQGLANMAERARESEAEYLLESVRGKGTRIVVKFPIPTPKVV
ncbi:MAG TPA: CHASE4 domain-containing protein [Opitutaceae bacterium]